LERLQGAVSPAARAACWDNAQSLLDEALKLQRKHVAGLLELATLLLDREDADALGRVGFLLEALGDRNGGARRKVLWARLQTRRGEAQAAETSLRKLLERDATDYSARAAYGEWYLSQGRVFEALKAMMEAQSAAPPHAPERVIYEQVIARLRHLIDSGQAIEMAKASEAAGIDVPAEAPPTAPVSAEMPQHGPLRGEAVGVRLAGRTTRRRKRKGNGASIVDEPKADEPTVDEPTVDEPTADETVES
jgi:tetratricopeptide (TPR) repeat protein